MSGVKTTITTTPPAASHQSAALKSGINVAGLTVQLSEAVGEVIYMLREILKTFPVVNLTCAGTISTSSASITMAATLPASIVSGMNVADLTNAKQIGTVLSASGTTLTLTANAANAGNGSTDVLQITDANLATYQGLVTSLS